MQYTYAPPPIGRTWVAIAVLGIVMATGSFYWSDLSLLGSILHPIRSASDPLILGPCSSYQDPDGPFARPEITEVMAADSGNDRPSTIDVWAKKYHSDVEEALEQHLGRSEQPVTIQCSKESDETFFPAVEKIQEIAETLPPWKGEGGTDELSRSDTSTVLLEYLRAYECALAERFLYIPAEVKTEEQRRAAQPDGMKMPQIPELTIISVGQMRQTLEEIAIARPTLMRALTFTSGLDRLGSLPGEVECLQRASIDIRNALALAADAGACFPRIWEAKDPLRDIYDPPE